MKTAILVTARLKSTRLPLKVIKPIKEKQMLSHMLDRLKLARRPNQIIICTSPVLQDDPIEELALREDVDCFRGDPEDVLLRLTEAAKKFNVDTVVNCSADNPFVDPEYIDRLVDFHVAHNFDYCKIEGLPFGTFSYALSLQAMIKACRIKAETDTEVWGGYFTETGHFRCGTMKVKDTAIYWPELRLTVDTPEDFELINRIFDELYEPGKIFSLRSIVNLCRQQKDLVKINASIQQKQARPIKINEEYKS